MVASVTAQFAGKWVLASEQYEKRTYFLTFEQFEFTDSNKDVPVMAATKISKQEYCSFYRTEKGFYIQFANGQWLTIFRPLGWAYLIPEMESAAVFRCDLLAESTELEVWDGNGYQPLSYSVNGVTPLLTTALTGTMNKFKMLNITPGIEEIKQAGACINADLTQVNLSGENLSGINFRNSDFTAANLSYSSCCGTDFTRCIFVDSQLNQVVCDGAVLDYSDLTRANLSDTNWGLPASAKGMRLVKCKAINAVLGDKQRKLDASGSILTGGDFTGASLAGWNLNRSILGEVLMSDCNLERADLSKVTMLNGCFSRANMSRVHAENSNGIRANFIQATLTDSDFSQYQFTSEEEPYLFSIDTFFEKTLNQHTYVSPLLIYEFENNGVCLSEKDEIKILIPQQKWTVGEGAQQYILELAEDKDSILVYLALNGQRVSAVLSNASCFNMKARSANLSGVNLQGIQWYGQQSSAEAANLENANLSDAFLLGNNFSGAKLSGANFSSSIAILGDFRNCTIKPGAAGQAFTFQNAQIQGARFEQSTLSGVLLTGCSVATEYGVPIGHLPLDSMADLNNEQLHKLDRFFETAQNPLSPSAMVQSLEGNIPLPVNLAIQNELLNELCSTDVGPTMPGFEVTTASNTWLIVSEVPMDFAGNVYFPWLLVKQESEFLQVYGYGKVELRKWDFYPEGTFFKKTSNIEQALNEDCIGPIGVSSGMLDKHLLTWERYCTAIQRLPAPEYGR